MPRPGAARALIAGTLLSRLPASPAAAHEGPRGPGSAPHRAPHATPERVRREISPDERRGLGEDHAGEHARTRLALRDAADCPDEQWALDPVHESRTGPTAAPGPVIEKVPAAPLR